MALRQQIGSPAVGFKALDLEGSSKYKGVYEDYVSFRPKYLAMRFTAGVFVMIFDLE